MKKFIAVICFVSVGIFYATFADARMMYWQVPKSNPITLSGSLLGPGRMSVGPKVQPVAVYQNPTNIEVVFSSNSGNLNIVVTNQYGYPVYQRTVNATAGGNVIISTQGWAAGAYTISITNEDNRCVEGAFAIE